MRRVAVLGLQYGDEGKGRIVMELAKNAGVCARFNGGPNAGHTVESAGLKWVTHQVPTGAMIKGCIGVLGRGMVIDAVKLEKEMRDLGLGRNDVKIDPCAHAILARHVGIDAETEQSRLSKIGTTLTGNGPCYSDKAFRRGFRIKDLLKEIKISSPAGEALTRIGAPWTTSEEINDLLRKTRNVLIEGAHGFGLDLDFGDYPNVTSSACGIGGVCSGLGMDPRSIDHVMGVIKPYTTRVGAGAMPKEYPEEEAEIIRKSGHEFGSTTGRPRRIASLDLNWIKRACEINGVNSLAVTHMDVAFDLDYVLINDFRNDVHKVRPDSLHGIIEETVGVPIELEGFGPDNKALRRNHEIRVW